MRETYIILTSDTWCVTIQVNLSTYSDVISTIRADFLIIEIKSKSLLQFMNWSKLKHYCKR